MGKMIAFGVTSGTLKFQSDWAWRLPFALQWMWPLPLLIAAYFAPESPWWLARKGRLEEAKHSLQRLASSSAPPDKVDHTRKLAWMLRTIEDERADGKTRGSYLDCFRGVNLRRTEVAMVSWGFQILPGFIVQSNITYFFTMAGLKTAYAFNVSIGKFMEFLYPCTYHFDPMLAVLANYSGQAMLALRLLGRFYPGSL